LIHFYKIKLGRLLICPQVQNLLVVNGFLKENYFPGGSINKYKARLATKYFTKNKYGLF